MHYNINTKGDTTEMANTKNKESMAYKNKLAYIKRKNKEIQRFYITLNPSTEQDLIEWIEGRKKATYVKQLIREDMNKKN